MKSSPYVMLMDCGHLLIPVIGGQLPRVDEEGCHPPDDHSRTLSDFWCPR